MRNTNSYWDLPEGYYLATSDDVQGLIAQGRTITETLEIARDAVEKLIESQSQKQVKKMSNVIKEA